MRTSIVSIILIFNVFLFAPASIATDPDTFEVPSGQLGLDQACVEVLQNNPGIQEVLQRLESAQATLLQARSSLWPSVTASTSYFGQDVTMCPDWDPMTRAEIDLTEFSASIQAHWTVFDGFARRAQILAAESQVEGVTYQVQEAYRLLLEAVTTTFYQIQLARERMIIALQNRSFNQELKDNAVKRWNVGDAPESDVLTFSVNALQAEVEYRSAYRDYQLICTVLAQLLALDKTELPLEMHPETTTTAPEYSQRNFDHELAYALEHRPDLMAMGSALTALQHQLTVARSAYWPRIDASAGYNYNFYDDPDTVDQEEHSAFIGLTASFDLFSGFRRHGQVREARATISGQEYARQNLILSIEAGIRSRILELEAAIDVYQKHQEAYTQTLKIRDYIERAYLAGEASITRLNEAQTNLVAISGQQATSKLMILLSSANLDITTGRILEINLKSDGNVSE